MAVYIYTPNSTVHFPNARDIDRSIMYTTLFCTA